MRQVKKNIKRGPEPLLLGEEGSQLMDIPEPLYKTGLGTAHPRGKQTGYLASIQLVQLWAAPEQKDSYKSPGQCSAAR